eukprot:TRINITY_DN15233_c0_g1_i1.p1 TRINITY_DN15233_c0_g1~~TRINITY_DN15233_c0_g1_i1.p1  ORF type:complete len:215 (+),score=60.33 TRINITY_DN15233_c0_g1_i1:63-707(+)
MFIREIELGEDEETVKLVKVDQKNEGDTGVVVWDAAIVLSKYLETINDDLANKSAIELGSGTGAVGLCAAALGCGKVVLTDREDFIEFLKHNIELNQELFNNEIIAQSLLWGDKDQIEKAKANGPFNFILVSDCVFYKESVDDLVDTLCSLCDGNTEIILSYEERDSQMKLEVMKIFFSSMKFNFTWNKVPFEKHHPEFRSEDIQIFRFKLRLL